MNLQKTVELTVLVILVVYMLGDAVSAMNRTEKRRLREKVLEMFHHAYGSYMKHAYPADELMPLSCKGRYRDTEPSRGDVDDSLGNFSLTLIDSLDTLVLLGEVELFEDAVRKVIEDVTFDNDIVVSVFETNIRVLGGLLGGHFLAQYLKNSKKGMDWYKGELLEKAQDLGQRLLPAFNTTTGIPYPRVNLRHGIDPNTARTGHEKDTCTACAGTTILEMAALSRLTGDPRFEAKAHQAMEYLWQQRHRSSDLVGTTINIHNGDWVRRESGVGAGIDSYYEYLLKAYILLGHDSYLERFNKHYDAIMRYISQGPMLMDVHMHRPTTNARNFMDSLLAFWPGLQVLKGDIKPAIEVHEMLYQVMQRHNFLPEAFTTDFRVYWGHHPLRPEFVESTYFIFKATSDPYYLEVGKKVMDNLEKHARVDCGFAAIKDVTTGQHEDQMDSFVLAETFKYLYLLFSEKEDLIIDVDDYVFTTEAHLLPLSLSTHNSSMNLTKDEEMPEQPAFQDDDAKFERSCPNTNYLFPGNSNYAHTVRTPLKDLVENLCPKPKSRRKPRLRALDFIAGNKGQVEELKRMGIKIVTMKDGRVQLLHTASEAGSTEDAEDGMLFMQDMIELSKTQQQEVQQEPRVVQLLSNPYFGHVVLNAGPAQFGYDLKKQPAVQGQLVVSNSLRACQPLVNTEDIKGKIVIMERGDCMFIDKARQIQAVGAIGGIVIDNNPGSSSDTAPLFAMSGDGKNDVGIPMVFLFHAEGKKLYDALDEFPRLEVLLGYSAKQTDEVIKDLLAQQKARMRPRAREKMDQSETSSKTVDHLEPTDTTTDDQPESIGAATTDQSENTRTTTVQSKLAESVTSQSSTFERSRKVLQKYLDRFKEAEAEVKNKDKPLINIDEILKVVEGPGNARQLSVKLTEDVDKKVNQVYEELVNLLVGASKKADTEDETEKQNSLNKLIEVFYVDPTAQKAKPERPEPGKRLEPTDEPMPVKKVPEYGLLPPDGSTVSAPASSTVAQGEPKVNPEHYASSEELAGEQVAPDQERKTAEWMLLKRDQAGSIFKAKDGEDGDVSTVPNLSGEGSGKAPQTNHDNTHLHAFSKNLFSQQNNLDELSKFKPQSASNLERNTETRQLNTAVQVEQHEHGSSASSTGNQPVQSQQTSGHTEPSSGRHPHLSGPEALPGDSTESDQGQSSQEDRTSLPSQEESDEKENNERTKDEL